MATPETNVQDVFINLNQHSPNTILLPAVLDLAGDPIDLSTGFTIQAAYQDDQKAVTSSRVLLPGTVSGDALGVITISQTGAQAADLRAGNFSIQVVITDDSFTTVTTTHRGTMAVARSQS